MASIGIGQLYLYTHGFVNLWSDPIHISGNPGYRLPDEYGRMPAQQPGQPDQPGYGQPGKPGFWSQGQPGYGKPDDIGRVPNQPGYGQFGPSSEQMQRRGKHNYFK